MLQLDAFESTGKSGNEERGRQSSKPVRDSAYRDNLQNYRSYIIWLCPSLRFVDYQRVRTVEREEAKELLGTQDEPSELAAKIRGVKSKTFDASSSVAAKGAGGAGKAMRTQLTASEKQRVQEMIKNARSLAEIARIEKDLAEGRIPQGAADADRMVS